MNSHAESRLFRTNHTAGLGVRGRIIIRPGMMSNPALSAIGYPPPFDLLRAAIQYESFGPRVQTPYR